MDDLLKEFDLLLMDYEDETISEKDLEKLRQMMKQHECLRERYVRHQMIEATMNKSDLKAISIADFSSSQQGSLKEVKAFPLMRIINVAATILVFLGVFFFYSKSSKNTVGEQTRIIGSFEDSVDDVTIIRNGMRIQAKKNLGIQLNDKIITTDSKVLFRYKDEETLIILQNHSELVLKEVAGAKRLHLKDGDIICDVAKQVAGKPMKIFTKDAITTVLGTQFLLSSKAAETKLQVSEGSVRIQEKDSEEVYETKAGWQVKTVAGSGLKVKERSYKNSSINIRRLVLINADENTEVKGYESLQNGDVISLSELGIEYFNILADADPEKISGVFFRFVGEDAKGQNIKVYGSERKQRRNKGHEPIFPYHIIGDGKPKAEVEPLSWKAEPGKYTLSVTPYRKGDHALGENVIVNFEIVK